MAGTLSTVDQLQYANGNVTLNLPTISKTVVVTGTHTDFHVQSIPTAATALSINASIVTPGIIQLLNTDNTNYVEVGIMAGGVFQGMGKLMPGDPPMTFRYDGNPIYLKANAAAVDVQCTIFES